MTVNLITGSAGTAHVTSDDSGAFNAAAFGTGAYVLAGCECAMATPNAAHVGPGLMLLQGRRVRVSGGEDLAIDNGSQGQKRHDLIVGRYAISGGIESLGLHVIKGVPSESPADPPHAGGSILDGDAAVDIPLYRIPLDGIDVGVPEEIVQRTDYEADGWHVSISGETVRMTKVASKNFSVGAAGAIFASSVMTETFPMTVSSIRSANVSICDRSRDGWASGTEAGPVGINWQFMTWFQFGSAATRKFSIDVEAVI